jgi:predicted peroxiredoxin
VANFLFILSQDDNEKATRCFQLAKISHSKGHHTHLFFIDGGVQWADSNRDFDVKTTTGDCPNDYFPYLVENQVPIGVCTPCATSRQVDEATFFTNMMLDGGPHLIELAAEAKVFNF